MKTVETTSKSNSTNTLLSEGFYITDFCNCCKCGEKVSPSQVTSENEILYDDKREKIVGFNCWQCGTWNAFPKRCQ